MEKSSKEKAFGKNTHIAPVLTYALHIRRGG